MDNFLGVAIAFIQAWDGGLGCLGVSAYLSLSKSQATTGKRIIFLVCHAPASSPGERGSLICQQCC